MRIVFAGTPDFAVPTLRALLRSQHQVMGVLTQPDRPAGRGRQKRPSSVKMLAESARLPVFQPEGLRRNEVAVAQLEQWQPDLVVVVAYGLILPQAVLDLPTHGCLNVHASLLPRWRGAAPINRCIQAGDQETGVSIMQMDRGLDTGDVLAQKSCPVEPRMTAGELHDRLAPLGAQLLLQVLDDLQRGRLTRSPQDNAQACYAAMLDKAEARIDWQRAADQIVRDIRAFNPWPVAHSRLGEANIRLWQAQVTRADRAGQPGEILEAGDDGIKVQCGIGQLCITRLQWPGKKALAATEAARGRALTGQHFE